MTITSDTFVAIIPSTEEEMLAIANSVIRLNNSREYYLSTIEAFQQLAGVMQEHLAHLDCKKKCHHSRWSSTTNHTHSMSWVTQLPSV